MTPYDAIFARTEFEEEIFPGIAQDAEAHGLDTWNVDEFLQLPSSAALREKLAPPGVTDAGPVSGVAALGFHGYHFWRNGKVSHALDEAAVRGLLDPTAGEIGEWRLRGPAHAGYVELPANLVWAKTEDATPEAVHGFFYATSPADTADDRLDVLVALGVRADRAGFTAIELTIPLPAPLTGHFGDIDARDGSDDFANVLPGGELRGLYAVTNAGEVLKLVSRALHHLATRTQ